MNLENDYPKIEKKLNRFLLIRKIMLIIFFLAGLTCMIVNLSMGGYKWFFYVIFGEIILYFAFLSKPLIDNILIKRLSILFLFIILYLYVINRLNSTNWSSLVNNILGFSLLIMQLLFFFIDYHKHKNKIVLMIITSIVSCIFCLLAILKVISINWAVITTGSIGLFTLLLLFTFYFKTTVRELHKYFSIR